RPVLCAADRPRAGSRRAARARRSRSRSERLRGRRPARRETRGEMRPSLLLASIAVAVPLSSAPARADVERYAVLIGDNRGAGDDVPLHYAETDAARVRDVLQELGGFAADRSVYLANVDAAPVRRTLIELNDRIRAHTDW